MADRLRQVAFSFPLAAGAVVFALFASRPVERMCDDGSALTAAQQSYVTDLKVGGAAIALACLGLMWRLARRGRSLGRAAGPKRVPLFDVALVAAGLVVVAGVTLLPQLIALFVLVGGLSIVGGWVGPFAAAGVYLAALFVSVDAAGDVKRERWSIRLTLLFYWLSLVLIVPGVFGLLALRVSPICF